MIFSNPFLTPAPMFLTHVFLTYEHLAPPLIIIFLSQLQKNSRIDNLKSTRPIAKTSRIKITCL